YMRMVKLLGLVAVTMLVMATPAFAQQPGLNSVTFSGSGVAAGIGMGLTVIGAGLGLGRIGAAAVESMARQPEVAPRIQTAMIIIAALLEGATFFALIVCIILQGSAKF